MQKRRKYDYLLTLSPSYVHFRFKIFTECIGTYLYKRKGDLGKALLAVREVCFDFFDFSFFFSSLLF